MKAYWREALPLGFLLCGGVWAGCVSLLGRPAKMRNLAEDRLVDLNVSRRAAGRREFLFFSLPQTENYLEGYIQGMITDYQENPIQGVVVRAIAGGGASSSERSASVPAHAFESAAFDVGISDSNGVYRIRFSLPVMERKVDLRGALEYNPGWEQMKTNLGNAYEPQLKQSPFHLFYDERSGLLTFDEGVRKVIVQPVESGAKALKPGLPGASAPPPVQPEKEQKKKGKKGAEEDLFKGFDFGP